MAAPEYSLVIFPNPEQIALVKEFKQKLRAQIGWFGSFNANAHITVRNFEDDEQLAKYLKKIKAFAQTQSLQVVNFRGYDHFGDKTFFIAPDAGSQEYLDNLIKDFHQYLELEPGDIHAHISIARGLDESKMEQAKSIFQHIPVKFSFLCDALYLRKFSQETKQYSEIAAKFPFTAGRS
jgi:hypothetical protein